MSQRPKPPRCLKVKYPTKTAATQALNRMGAERGELRPYRCGKHVQSAWHLTSRPKLKGRW